ncbi:oligopeptidase A [Methylocaldum sp.]|uniref:oligopeptidase A n=1 Tax=Methylocaldum sp. TaxID=1969727 RepID=UPI002D335EF3|nr:oligopeptidase A [Methylocaldum sp.]HYE35082.1 oligopeptidase A [Methylocaldum sp.]
MSNPLLDMDGLPSFSRIKAEHVVPAVDRILEENRAAIAELLESGKTYAWENLVEPLEDLDDRLNKAWSPVSHMNAVVNSDELREAYNACLPRLSEYATEIGQNEDLYAAYRSLAESAGATGLDIAQKKVLENALRDFRLSGVELSPEKKSRFKEIAQELSKLSSQFQDNVLDATHAWSKHIEDEKLLSGLPESAIAMARQSAAAQGKNGWLFSLEFPSYIAVMTYADDRDLRREFYIAYNTRASDQGPNAGRWDNSEVMEKMLALRHEEARLLGFSNYAELSLATKMAPSTDEVMHFLSDLAHRSLPHARGDLEELQGFASREHGQETLESWDLTYYSEKLRQYKFALSEEEIRTYFPVTRVVPGMFGVVERLYGLQIREKSGVDVWHPDVKFYEIHNRSGELLGSFYLDLYARPKKRGGAWMDECVTRRRIGQNIQHPVAYLTCNFTPPTNGDPSLLRHDEVLTLFHEFGHGLHHMLTKVDYLGVSGIHGVEWDAVELPSQFMENFCWEPEALGLISGHYRTGEPLPKDLLDKMTAARNFQSGMQMVRQLEFSLFDFRIHLEYEPSRGGRVYPILDDVRKKVAVFIPPSFNRFPHSFSHIFGGGYAAGYYSYKWAEVLSSDAFSLFEEKGVFAPDVGRSFLENILERGGSRKAMELFTAFRGREPTIDALLRHNGIVEAA